MENSWLRSADSRILSHLSETKSAPPELISAFRNGSNSDYLDALASLALCPDLTTLIFSNYEPIFVDVCARWLLSTTLTYSVDEAHLSIAAAISQILPLAPHLVDFAEKLIFEGTEVQKSPKNSAVLGALSPAGTFELSSITDHQLVVLLLTHFRLLQFNLEKFRSLIATPKISALFSHSRISIRYLAIRVLCLSLGAGDAALENMLHKFVGDEEIMGPWEDKSIDYVFLQYDSLGNYASSKLI
jgi:midasin